MTTNPTTAAPPTAICLFFSSPSALNLSLRASNPVEFWGARAGATGRRVWTGAAVYEVLVFIAPVYLVSCFAYNVVVA